MSIRKNLSYLFGLSILLQYTLASPLGLITNTLLFPPTNNTPPSLSLLPYISTSNQLPTLPLLPSNLTDLRPSNLSATSNAGKLTSEKWVLAIMKGLYAVWAESPDAILGYVFSDTEDLGKYGHVSIRTTNPADLRFFKIICHEVQQGPEDEELTIRGVLDPGSGQVSWGEIRRKPWIKVGTFHQRSFWPPDHDIFQASAVLDPKLAYWRVLYGVQFDRASKKPLTEYVFEDSVISTVATVDAETLKLLP